MTIRGHSGTDGFFIVSSHHQRKTQIRIRIISQKEETDMRHMIIRALGTIAWMASGIVCLTQGKTDVAIISLALGAVYGLSCYRLIKQSNEGKK